MTKIFVGFLFVFLNFNLTLNDTYVINLLPDFVGFILLYMGTRELLRKAPATPQPVPGCWDLPPMALPAG